MTMISNLNKNLCKKDSRFKLVDDYGDGYRGYSYTSPESGKGVYLSTHRTGGMTYLSISIWQNPETGVYERDKPFTSDEWFETAESELTGMFNGVESINLERLVCICEKVIKGVDRLTAEVLAEPELDMTPVVERLKVELELVDPLIEEGKAMEWWKLSGRGYRDYELREAASHLNWVMDDRKSIVDWKPSESRARNKEYLDRVKNSGCMYFAEDCNHAKWLRESIAKCKEVKSDD